MDQFENSQKAEQFQSEGYCPSCMKSQDRIAICDDCVERRDRRINHSEEDIQKEIRKNLDKR